MRQLVDSYYAFCGMLQSCLAVPVMLFLARKSRIAGHLLFRACSVHADIGHALTLHCIAIISGSIGCDMQSITIYLKMIEMVSSAENAADVSNNEGGMTITVHPSLFPVRRLSRYTFSSLWFVRCVADDRCMPHILAPLLWIVIALDLE